MRIAYILLGLLLITAAALIYGAGPSVDFASSHYVSRFVDLATPMLGILGVVLIGMAIVVPPRKADPKKAEPEAKPVKAKQTEKPEKAESKQEAGAEPKEA